MTLPATPKVGDYVLATKYRDGDPGDHWAIGFYAGEMAEYIPPRYAVVDSDGKPFRANGFRRIARITPERGAWLLSKADIIEQGSRSVWWWKRARMSEKEPSGA